MATYRVDVQPDVLIWARESIGMTVEEAAAKLDVDAMTVRYWEAGAYELAQPTLVLLRKMAQIYRRPLSAFYFSKPPDEPKDSLPDFRTLRVGSAREWSPELHETYRRVRMQRAVAVELAEAADETPEPLSLSLRLSDNPEIAGREVRAWLGVSLSEQLNWRHDHQALAAWSAAIEGKGILVAQSRRVPLREMRGFSLSDQPFPVIVLNGYDKPRPKIFTLLHELTHVLLHTDGLCDLGETTRARSPQESVEAFCNQVAGAALLPPGAMQEELDLLGVTSEIAWPDTVLWQLANRYHVSREVILRRMVTLGRASLGYYFIKLNQYAQQYVSEVPKPRDGGPDAAVLKLRDMGRRYTADVLRAYDRRDIDAAELSEYLDAKVEQVPKLVALLEGRA